MKITLRIFLGAKKYWMYLIMALIALIISTVAGFYAPWALRELTSIATEGHPNFASKAFN